MDDPKQFDLTEEDEYAIEVAISVAQKLLRKAAVSPREIAGLGHALYALKRLPDTTPGAYVEFGVAFRQDFEYSGGMRYVTFIICEFAFEISRGGSEWDKHVGSDSFSEPGWRIEIGAGARRECFHKLADLEEAVQEYLNLGGTISVADESEIEFE